MKTYYAVLCEGWQIECCGRPFSIGDVVRWDVFAFNKTLTDITQTVEYIYDAHCKTSDGLLTLQGAVHQIDAIYAEYKSSTGNPQFLIPVSSLPKSIVKADRDEEKMNGMTLNSYIIMLGDVSIKEVASKQYTT